MAYLQVEGGRALEGQVEIAGAKNAALPILFATILVRGTTILYRVPDIGDVRFAIEILTRMGARVTYLDTHTLSISTDALDPMSVPLGLTGYLRASSYLMGACLGRFGKCVIPTTGGCDFGARPLNWHHDIFTEMGAEGETQLCAPKGLRAIRHTFSSVSVGATINASLAAVGAEGTTILKGCAKEGHVRALLQFLRQAGACIRGIGTDEIVITGGVPLRGTRYTIIPDEIEAGTYLSACAATGGRLTVLGISPHALRPLTKHLGDMGCQIEEGVFSITCRRTGALGGTIVTTGPHPAFPTDLHPPLVAAMCRADTPSRLTETIWQDRFQYTQELEKLGANFSLHGDTIEVYPSELVAHDMTATDLRGGAAALIGALCCKGVSRIDRAEILSRGYESLAVKFSSLGASVRLYS